MEITDVRDGDQLVFAEAAFQMFTELAIRTFLSVQYFFLFQSNLHKLYLKNGDFADICLKNYLVTLTLILTEFLSVERLRDATS